MATFVLDEHGESMSIPNMILQKLINFFLISKRSTFTTLTLFFGPLFDADLAIYYSNIFVHLYYDHTRANY